MTTNVSSVPPTPLVTGRQNRAWHSIGRGLGGLAVALIALGSIGTVYQAFATVQDRRTYPAPGRMVDVGGHPLHLNVMGTTHPGPTVVLEAGLGMASPGWAWVQPEVSQFGRVVAYDRAGLGWSKPGPAPRTGSQIARELHTALHQANIPGPYILVGHSLGGLFARVFTDLYPDEVVGLVLVDSSHPDQWDRSEIQRQALPRLSAALPIFSVLARLGVTRFVDLSQQVVVGLPDLEMVEMRSLMAQPSAWDTARAEYEATMALTRDEVRQAASLGERPLAVVTAAKTVALDPVHGELQAELAGLSSNHLHLIVDGSDHGGVVFGREYAPKVVEAIRQVVVAARTGQRLNAR